MMFSFFSKAILIISLTLFQICYASDKTVIGWIEPVAINNGQIVINAKIDTGADHPSITVYDLHAYRSSNSDWIRFNIIDATGKKHLIEKPVEKHTRIKRKAEKSERRPVIKLDICLANQRREMKVSVTSATGYKYKMLIGRSYLKDLFVVDSALKNTTQPECTQNK
ncbi:MAG: ATP-dependent zinc protease [Gammaproteobacteria bacterium]